MKRDAFGFAQICPDCTWPSRERVNAERAAAEGKLTDPEPELQAREESTGLVARQPRGCPTERSFHCLSETLHAHTCGDVRVSCQGWERSLCVRTPQLSAWGTLGLGVLDRPCGRPHAKKMLMAGMRDVTVTRVWMTQS